MAIAKTAILQQIAFREEIIDRMGDLSTADTRLHQAHTQFMRLDIRLPKFKARRIHFAHKHRALKRGVIARDHWEGIEAQDITALQNPPRDRVMRAIGVKPRLEPYPSVPIFGIGKAFGDFQLHRIAPCHGDINLTHPRLHGVPNGITAHIGNLRACADQLALSDRFHHALAHRSRRDIGGGFWCQELSEKRKLAQDKMIGFVTNCLALPRYMGHGAPVIVALPIGIGDPITGTAPPWLPRIDTRRDHDRLRCGHNQRIGAAKGTVEKTRVIGDIVHRTEHNRI